MMEQIAVTAIGPSRTNPRLARVDHGDLARLAELTDSIRAHGVLQPVLVRPRLSVTVHKGSAVGPTEAGIRATAASASVKKYELVCGHRRLAAAAAAGLTEVPAIVRTLSDQEALEVQLVENLQRSDLHPLEEAEGYHQLARQPGYTVAKVAAKIGRSARYVYDRMKLLALTKPARAIFLEGKITAGHAVLLARLSAKDQARAMAVDDRRGHGGLFEPEALLWDPERDEDDATADAVKARSVGELQAWIDEHVKFNAAAPDVPDLFPETAALVKAAQEAAEKIVPITGEHFIQPDARDGQRVFGPRSWKRADGGGVGKRRSRTCPKSVTGVFVIGAGRGTAMKVCIDRACKVHWRESKRRAATATRGGSSPARDSRAEEKRKTEEAAREALRARWKKAAPAITKAVAEAIRKAPATASGPLAKLLVRRLTRGRNREAVKLVPLGRSAEDVLRHLAFLEVYYDLTNDWNLEDGIAIAKALGVDAMKVLAAAAPVEKPAAAKPAKPGKK